ncbi:MAG: chorismate synthase [Clostridia bacterium]|nr:chorismate synthase [Clostridia bacterium]
MSCSFGKNICYTVFGQSHSESIGCVIDGIPAGEKIDMEKLRSFMKRRAPGQDSFSTPRKEADLPSVVSGMVDGVTCGAPVCAVIQNTNTRSQDYDKLKNLPRPSHADYPALIRYAGMNDPRGGGNFSGRMTAPLCFAGGLLMQILESKGIEIGAHIKSISNACDEDIDFTTGSINELKALESKPFPVISDEAGDRMKAEILKAKAEGDSVGGVIECVITGVPAGVGDPIFDGIENRLASAIFGIPAVRGIEFGVGFRAAKMCGSEHNDPYYLDGDSVKTKTNNHGGVIGGITSGMPIIFRVAFKPTPSIGKEQTSLNIKTGEEEAFSVPGRHDPCIVQRAVPVVQAAAALVIADFLLK